MMAGNEETYIFRCSKCELDFHGVKRFRQHFRNVHHVYPLQCGQRECMNNYEHFTSLIRHIKVNHINQEDEENEDVQMEHLEQQGSSSESENAEPDACEPPLEEVPQDENMADFEPIINEDEVDLTKSAARMILNLRQTGGITNSIIERFQEECLKLVNDVSAVYKRKVTKFLRDEDINTEAARELVKGLEIQNPFLSLQTLKQQLNYFSNELGLVKPITQFLSYRMDYRLNPTSNQYEPMQVSSSFEYIPIIETLKLVVSNTKMRTLIEAEKPSEDGVMRSYLDGSRVQDHPLIRDHPDILRLQLFWDDVEVVNPLGSKTSIHKLAALYFSIQNLPPIESSQLSSVYLLALAYTEDVKSLGGFDKILTPFLMDLKKLESANGVKCKIEGETFNLRATLTALCADALAAHDMLGFLSPSARHFCRKCMISRPQFHLNCLAMGEKRTKDLFATHVQMVKETPALSTECGVKRDCPLHQAMNFSATDDSVFDIFHDLLEGVCQFEILLTLNHFVKSKYFKIEEFNARITAFNYGIPDIRNKPSANLTVKSLKGSHLQQSGSQVWCLMRVFGFLTSDVPENDLHLKLINLLQEIMLIVFSEEIRNLDIIKLEDLIRQHHSLFQQLHMNAVPGEEDNSEDDDLEGADWDFEARVHVYPSEDEDSDPDEPEPAPGNANLMKVKPKNKLHHILHYPDQIREFGPLVRCWCARYEARHHIFSKYGQVCCNFINLPKSMAQMHQISTLSGLLRTSFRADEKEIHSASNLSVEESAHCNLLIDIGFKLTDVIADAKAILIAGEDYRPGLFVLIDANIPSFGLIKCVYSFEDKVYFVLVPWQTEGFEKRFCAYRVQPSDATEAIILSHKSLPKHGAFATWNRVMPVDQRAMYIAPRTIIF